MNWLTVVVLLFAGASGKVDHIGIHFPDDATNLLERTFDGGPGSKIINGVPSKLYSRPYQASLQVYKNNVWNHYCGAVIIDRDVLVCAAHCLRKYPAEILRVEVGSLNLQAPPLKYTQFLEVLAYQRHENFSLNPDQGFPNDIGLIFLKNRITYNENVQPIRLAPPGLNFDNSECVISGWGLTNYLGPAASPVLLEGKVRKLTYEKCVALHLEVDATIDRNHVCVLGESGDDVQPAGGCNGDSGGPLMCEFKRRRYLIGVASYVWDYCDVNYPTVYTRVSGFISWINRNKDLYSNLDGSSEEQ
ncbi:chymotrypsin-1-like [Biomphalaria glabrata]|uniref:Chymotrypsin-1-like n=1 Tax=Biomphalaria glabrata TaxID=6526 RepID=A0A9W2ZIE2_BIOGL|nr:chymotrypsin-1-like [Biomphalaria glabrata]